MKVRYRVVPKQNKKSSFYVNCHSQHVTIQAADSAFSTLLSLRERLSAWYKEKNISFDDIPTNTDTSCCFAWKVDTETGEGLDTYYDSLGKTLGEALLAPTRIYVKALKNIKKSGVTVKACSHITGGGFYENVPRMLKDGVRAVIRKDSYPVPPIFKLLAEKGQIEEQMMYNTFNMGLGMVVAVDEADVDKTMAAIKAAGDQPYVVGTIENGEKGVTLC